MPNAPQVFPGITPAQFAALSQKAHASGIAMTGHTGTVSKFGVEVAWDYSPAKKHLSIQCLSTPFFMKPEDVDTKIKSLVNETLASDTKV